MKFISHSAAETKKIAADFTKKLMEGDPPKAGAARAPVMIGLIGDLGSGKTTFVQGMAEGLGIDSRHTVNSPTFTLVNEYGNLIHVDLYRIEKPTELLTLGLEDYRKPQNLVVIEWAEKLGDFPVQLDYEIRFETEEKGERRIEICPMT